MTENNSVVSRPIHEYNMAHEIDRYSIEVKNTV